ncbi:unnamed protein product [marine sediment metagenome]|uniref:Type 4 fimbrial biogenesis protein PilX N-terminal domain-containing protein n=1 Tax=marine sediment metagenome TaxID=412755 RepID=X1CAI3_9ZZZZ
MGKIYRNRKAVANIVGTILMLGIIVPAISIFAISFTNIVTTQRAMMNAQIAVMQRFKDYMDEVYFYFSPEYDSVNHTLNITGEFPSNRAVNVIRQPTCRANVSNEDGSNLVVSFFEFEYDPVNEIWRKDVFCESNTTIEWKYENANQGNVTYYWRVAVYDGTTTTKSEIYSFRTSPSESPIS